jgi:hypothetical protein
MEEGWAMEDQKDYVIQVKTFHYDDQKRYDGSRATRGDKKLTFEVIGDHRCNSYDVERVPSYRLAIHGLREGIAQQLYDDFETDPELGQKMDLALKKKKEAAVGGTNNHKRVNVSVDTLATDSSTPLGSSPARPTSARPGSARPGSARPGSAQQQNHHGSGSNINTPSPQHTGSNAKQPKSAVVDSAHSKEPRNFTFEDFLQGKEEMYKNPNEPEKKKKKKKKSGHDDDGL